MGPTLPGKVFFCAAVFSVASALTSEARADPSAWKMVQLDMRQISLKLHFEKKSALPAYCDAEETLVAHLETFFHYDVFQPATPEAPLVVLPFSTIDVVVENQNGTLWATVRYLDANKEESYEKKTFKQPVLKCGRLMRSIGANIAYAITQNTPPLPPPPPEEPPKESEPCQTQKPEEKPPPRKSALLPFKPRQTLPALADVSIGGFFHVAMDPDVRWFAPGAGFLFRYRGFTSEVAYLAFDFEKKEELVQSLLTTLTECPYWRDPITACLLVRAAFNSQVGFLVEPGIRLSLRVSEETAKVQAKLSLDILPHPSLLLRPITLSASLSTNTPLL